MGAITSHSALRTPQSKMVDFIKNPVVPLPDRQPEPHFTEDELVFTEDEKERIAAYVKQYPSPEGAVMLKIPPGSTQGRTMRLKGRGIPSSPAGDFYAVLKISLPPADSEKAKDLYRQMERDLPFDPRAGLGV